MASKAKPRAAEIPRSRRASEDGSEAKIAPPNTATTGGLTLFPNLRIIRLSLSLSLSLALHLYISLSVSLFLSLYPSFFRQGYGQGKFPYLSPSLSLSLSVFLSPGLQPKVAPRPRASSAPVCYGASCEIRCNATDRQSANEMKHKVNKAKNSF